MTPGNSTLRVIVKSVDYSKKSISDLPFK
jgi:hypothetical protein